MVTSNSPAIQFAGESLPALEHILLAAEQYTGHISTLLVELPVQIVSHSTCVLNYNSSFIRDELMNCKEFLTLYYTQLPALSDIVTQMS